MRVIRYLIVFSFVYWTLRSFSAVPAATTANDVAKTQFLTRCNVTTAVKLKEGLLSSVRIEKINNEQGLLHLVVQSPAKTVDVVNSAETKASAQSEYEVKTISGRLKANGGLMAFMTPRSAAKDERATLIIKGQHGTMTFQSQNYPVTCQSSQL